MKTTSEQTDSSGNESSQSQLEIKEARKRAAFSIFLNLLLAVGKGVAGVMGGSAALIGDAVHSGTDVIASMAAFIGLWLAGKKHPSFPYGLYKAETIATLIISGIIILAGYEIGRQAFLGGHTTPDIALTLPVAVASFIIALSFGFYQLYQGRRLHSRALEADARDYLADAFSTGVVVFSLAATYFGLNLDRWAAGSVALFIFWAGGHLFWQALMDLMDEAIDRETERKIIGLVENHPRVEKVERCLSRTAGGRFIVDIDAVIRSQSHDMAHRISHALEADICRAFPRVVMARIKTHSSDSPFVRRLTPLETREGPVAPFISKAPWFLLEIIDQEAGTIQVQYFKNPYIDRLTQRGVAVGKWLLSLKPDQLVIPKNKEGAVAILMKEAGVELMLLGKDDTSFYKNG